MNTQTQMKKYYGSKNLTAMPMNLGAYNEYRGWKIPENENPEREGYLVQYEDQYQSWSPKEVFESAYREISALTFGQAIELLKQGFKVARSGWNGKGMYLWLLPASEVKKEWIKDPMLLQVFGDKDTLDMLGSIRMLTATGEVLTGWLASQSDMLAEDWQIVE